MAAFPVTRPVGIGLLVLAAGLPGGCQPRNTFVPPPPPEVTVARPVGQEIRDHLQYTGTTQAIDRVEIKARVDGYLNKITFTEGATVEKGDLLFTIEQAPYKMRLKAAQANLEKAQAELQLARANLARTRVLAQRNVTTTQEFDLQLAQEKTRAVEVKAAEVALEAAELDLSYTEVRAPISGRIGRHLVDVGNLVTAEETLLATIESIDPIHAYFSISEPDLHQLTDTSGNTKLSPGDEGASVLYLGVGGGSGFPHKGRLDYQDLGVDPETGTVLHRGIFPNPGHALIPGSFVRIQVPVGEPVPHLFVEERALATDLRGDYVLVVNDQNVVEYRPVKLGIAAGDLRVIESGLKPTDWVVINGLQRARPGEKVDPQRSEMKSPGKESPLVATTSGGR